MLPIQNFPEPASFAEITITSLAIWILRFGRLGFHCHLTLLVIYSFVILIWGMARLRIVFGFGFEGRGVSGLRPSIGKLKFARSEY